MTDLSSVTTTLRVEIRLFYIFLPINKLNNRIYLKILTSLQKTLKKQLVKLAHIQLAVKVISLP